MIYDKYQFRIPEGKMVRMIVNTDAKNEADDSMPLYTRCLAINLITAALLRLILEMRKARTAWKTAMTRF